MYILLASNKRKMKKEEPLAESAEAQRKN